MEDTDADEVSFNAFLMDKQNAAVATLLAAVFKDKSRDGRDGRDGRDLSQAIIENVNYGLFDEGIGLQMAALLIEMMHVTARSNMNARLTKELAGDLMRELNGLYTENGAVVSIGLKNRLACEIKSLRKFFFPKAVPVIITPKIN
jgi:hypothetical protein